MSSISNIANAASTDAAVKVQPKKAPTTEAAAQPQTKAEAPARPMPSTSSFSATA